MTIAIFGGTFDPIHNAHIHIIRYLSRRFDKVIVVPNSQSPFKNTLTSVEHRLAMIELALKGIPNVFIDEQELNRQPPSFTIDTVQNIKHQHSKDKLYLCIGQDAAKTFQKWHKPEQLAQLCTLAILDRKTYGLTMLDDKFAQSNCVAKAKVVSTINNSFESINAGLSVVDTIQLPYDYIVLDAKFEATSSSVVRVACSLGWGKCFLPYRVYNYASSKALYTNYKSIAKQLYKSKFKLSQERIEHIKRTVLNGIQLATVVNENIDKTVIALLLHDIAKNLSVFDLQQMGIDTTQVQPLHKNLQHSLASKLVAQKFFGIGDNDILNAIQYHTTGRPDMSKLEKVVHLADWTEQGRLAQFESNLLNLHDIINIAYSGNLDKAMKLALQDSIQCLKDRALQPSSQTLQALEFYSNI